MNILVQVKKLRISQIPFWPLGYQVGACFVGSLILFLMGYILFISPQATQIQQERQQEVMLKLQVKNSINKYGEMLFAKDESEQLAILLKKLLSESDQPVNDREFLQAISSLAKKDHIEIKSITPQKKGDYLKFSVLPIKVSAIGGYHNIAHFIISLLGSPNLITIEDLIISTGPRLVNQVKKKVSPLSMVLVLNIYWANKQVQEKASK